MNWYNKQLDINQIDSIIDSFLFDNKIEKMAQLVSPRLLPNFIKWRDKGYSPEQLGKKFKIAPRQVNQILKRYDSSHEDPVFMDKQKEQRILQEVQTIKDRGKQVSVLGIANKLNNPKDVVQYVINKNNITDIKGRREGISPEIKKMIADIAKKYQDNNVQFSMSDIMDEIVRKTGSKVSRQTIDRILSSLGISASGSKTDPQLQHFLYAFWGKYGGFWNTLINKSPEEKVEIINNTIDKWVYKGITPQNKSQMKQYFLDKVQLRDKAQSHYYSRPTSFNTNWSQDDWDNTVKLLENGWDIDSIQSKTGWPINVIQEIANRYQRQQGEQSQIHPSEMLFPRE